MKKLTTFKGLKAGDQVKVVNNCNSHNYEVGKVYIMKNSVKGSADLLTAPFVDYARGDTIRACDCVLLNDSVEGMEIELKELEADYKKSKKELQDKLTFCREAGVDEFDEQLKRVYDTLVILDRKGWDSLEKAKAISKLLEK